MAKRMNRKNLKAAKPAAPSLTRRQIWCYRLITLLGVPLIILLALELMLRLAGFGQPTAFLLPSENHGQKTYVQNDQFGWQFFGANMSRLPEPISITRQKPPGNVRIFVFGESAAFGDPQPRYGLPRMLQAMLEQRHPGVTFEVIDAAMTAINSHTILPIARDCTKARGDVWVIYMGNNEVVGPFGAGTVFGPQAPTLPIIRASLALKTTRTGQLMGSLLNALHPPPSSQSEWGGMEMFLNQRIRMDDPRMKNVYQNFQQNLADVISEGTKSGAGIVLSTVAVNLKDCAPFASLHQPGLSVGELAEWETNFNGGVSAQQAGQFAKARTAFQLAAETDNSYAELHFRMGECELATGDEVNAQTEFAQARDLDALRFRCDSRLNELIREAAGINEGKRFRLTDAEKDFATASPDGLPGTDLFYEHVHLTFEGNYLLAKDIAGQVEQLLPATVAAASQPWPDIADCARRLARTDRALQQALSEMRGRLADPPFTWQLNHADQMRLLAEKSRRLEPENSPDSLRAAQSACEAAIAGHPEDAILYQQLAELKQAEGDYPGMSAAAKQSLDLVPGNTEAWTLFGLALAQQQQYESAADAFRHDFALNPEDVWGRQNLAICLEKLGRRDEAIHEFQRALKIKPRFGLAWLGLGQVYEEMGQTNQADACFQKALANPIHRADELTTLARFCQSRKWFAAAATNYAEAIKLSPADPTLRMEAGEVLSDLNRHAEAAEQFKQATQLSPNLGQAYFLCGLELGRLGKPDAAEPEFREAARLMPGVAQAQLNLAITLFRQQKDEEARAAFQSALQIDPDNAMALNYLNSLNTRALAKPRP
jgi:tetratricopeptide (TPR) repeat protein